MGLLLVAAGVDAQEKLRPKEGDQDQQLYQMAEHKIDGKETSRLNEMKRGDLAPAGEAKLLNKAACFYVYRLTTPAMDGDKSMNDLVRDASLALLLQEIRTKKHSSLKDTQKAYLDALGKEMNKCAREVFKTNRAPIVRVNAARILAAVAEAGTEDTADTFITLIANPDEDEATKLWALRGLKELLACGTPEKSIFQSGDRELNAIAAAQAFLARDIKKLPDDPAKLEAIRYLRREAVRVLGSSRYATLPKAKDASGRTLWWLLKVARKDGMTPESSLSEQVEGAIGACHLSGKDVNYDYVAHHVGAAIVDFATEYGRKKGGDDTGLQWKFYAARLTNALTDLETHAKGTKSAGYVDEMISRSRKIAQSIEKGQEADPMPLQTWVRTKMPSSTTVYNGVADSTIKPADGAGG